MKKEKRDVLGRWQKGSHPWIEGKHHSLKARKLMSKFARARFAKPEEHKKQYRRLKKYYASHPGALKEMSKRAKKYWTPARKAVKSKEVKEYFKKHPEAGKAHAEQIRRHYTQHPELSEEYILKMQKYWKSASWRRRMGKTKRRFYEKHPEWQLEQSERIKRFAKEHPEWIKEHSRKMRKWLESPEYHKRLSDIRKEFFRKNPEERKRIGERSRKYYAEHPEAIENWMKTMNKLLHIMPNKQEQKLIDLFRRNKIPLKYVGDYSITIGRSNPDFINFKKKKIVEHFGVYWHGKKHTGTSRKRHEVAKIKEYAKLGYNCLVIWEDELSDMNNVLKKVKKFMKY